MAFHFLWYLSVSLYALMVFKTTLAWKFWRLGLTSTDSFIIVLIFFRKIYWHIRLRSMKVVLESNLFLLYLWINQVLVCIVEFPIGKSCSFFPFVKVFHRQLIIKPEGEMKKIPLHYNKVWPKLPNPSHFNKIGKLLYTIHYTIMRAIVKYYIRGTRSLNKICNSVKHHLYCHQFSNFQIHNIIRDIMYI